MCLIIWEWLRTQETSLLLYRYWIICARIACAHAWTHYNCWHTYWIFFQMLSSCSLHKKLSTIYVVAYKCMLLSASNCTYFANLSCANRQFKFTFQNYFLDCPIDSPTSMYKMIRCILYCLVASALVSFSKPSCESDLHPDVSNHYGERQITMICYICVNGIHMYAHTQVQKRINLM